MAADSRGPGVVGDDREPQLNADLDRPAFADTGTMPWQGSPAEGVQRRRLELAGDNAAPRLTTVVRFAPGGDFPAHTHDGGEEFLVLDGVFSDGEGDHPAGSYVRNPPGSRHAPSTREGCQILVKLRQFAAGDTQRVVLSPAARRWEGLADGLHGCKLHRFGSERVDLLRWDASASWNPVGGAGGTELFVLDGGVTCEGRSLSRHDWLRLPPGRVHELHGTRGTLAWLKTGHLNR